MASSTRLRLAFCPTAPLTAHSAATRRISIHPLPHAQFARRARPTPPPQHTSPAHLPTFTTPSATLLSTATLISSISSVASTAAGVCLLGFIIFVHESGHFLAARLQRIRVKNFSIGFGPRLFSFTPKTSDTEFSFRLLPLGGYVAFPEHVSIDEETGEQTFDEDPDLLQNRPIRDRAIVISAGVVANIILAWTSIFCSISGVGVPTYSFNAGVTVAAIVDPQGPAAQAGLQQGDVILSVDGKVVESNLDNAGRVAEKIRTSGGRTMKFKLLREKNELDVGVKARCCTPEGNAAMGIQLIPNAKVKRVRPPTVLRSFELTNSEFGRLSKQTWLGLSSMFSNFKASSQNLSGPIGVVSMGAELARNDTAALLTFCAVISINLALINSLPLPALDGGQMTFLIIEALRGSPVSLRVQDAVNRTALLLFLAFSGALFFGDLEKLNIVGAIQKLLG